MSNSVEMTPGEKLIKAIGSGSIVALLFLMIAPTVLDLTFAGTRPNPLSAKVTFEGGLFWQRVEPERGTKFATWAAEINGPDGPICNGGGNAPYERKDGYDKYTPDEWTGGDCSALILGEKYRAVAVWEYFEEDGTRAAASVEFDFIYTEPKEAP